jgi:hypothetical protein
MATTGEGVGVHWEMPRVAIRFAFLLLALSGALFLGGGCAARQHEPVPAEEEETSIERPAVPLSEETSWTDRIGEVGVVLLVVGVAVGLILLPILLL